MDKKSIVNDLYQAAVISVLAVGYSMLGKKILKMTPPSIQKFDLEDMGKLVAIVAASEMTREYLIKQKILPDHINVYERTKEPQQVTQVTKEPQVQGVTTKNPKKVEAGKRLAESNRKKREAKKQTKFEKSGVNQYYGIGAVFALGVIGGLGYYIYRTKKGEQPQQNNPKPHP